MRRRGAHHHARCTNVVPRRVPRGRRRPDRPFPGTCQQEQRRCCEHPAPNTDTWRTSTFRTTRKPCNPIASRSCAVPGATPHSHGTRRWATTSARPPMRSSRQPTRNGASRSWGAFQGNVTDVLARNIPALDNATACRGVKVLVIQDAPPPPTPPDITALMLMLLLFTKWDGRLSHSPAEASRQGVVRWSRTSHLSSCSVP